MKTVVYSKETGEVSGVYDGSVQLTREMKKTLQSVTVNSAVNIDSEVLAELIPNHKVESPKYTNIYSSIIPKDISHVIIQRDRTGLGDTISLLSAVQQLRKSYPDIKITVRAWGAYIKMLENHPDINHLEDCQKIKLGTLSDDEMVIDVGKRCPAGDYESARQSLTDKSRNEIFTIALGLRWQGEEPKLYLNMEEKRFGYNFVQRVIKREGEDGDLEKPNLAVVIRSAEPWKDWIYTESFCQDMIEKYNVFTVDQKMILDIEGVYNLAEYRLGIRQLMSVLPYMDCVVSPDTGIMHMCDGLDVPCVSMFGSMIGKLYNQKYDNTLTIVQGECVLGKSPCFYEVCEGRANYQPCMGSIKPSYIADIVSKVIDYGSVNKFNKVSENSYLNDPFKRNTLSA